MGVPSVDQFYGYPEYFILQRFCPQRKVLREYLVVGIYYSPHISLMKTWVLEGLFDLIRLSEPIMGRAQDELFA